MQFNSRALVLKSSQHLLPTDGVPDKLFYSCVTVNLTDINTSRSHTWHQNAVCIWISYLEKEEHINASVNAFRMYWDQNAIRLHSAGDLIFNYRIGCHYPDNASRYRSYVNTSSKWVLFVNCKQRPMTAQSKLGKLTQTSPKISSKVSFCSVYIVGLEVQEFVEVHYSKH